MNCTINISSADSFLVVSICLIPGARKATGKAAYLGAFTTVFAHPGRRFGQMAEALILVLGGTLLGIAWSNFGIYLGSLVMPSNPAAAYTIRGVFLAIATMFHGFLRSHAPRLFQFVLLLIIVSVVNLTSVATSVTRVAVTQILYPIFIAAGILLMVNLLFFPEFSSRYLGETTIETLNEATAALRKAGNYFTDIDEAIMISTAMEPGVSEKPVAYVDPGARVSNVPQANVSQSIIGKLRVPKLFKKNESARESSRISEPPKGIHLGELTKAKGKLRTKTKNCRAAQRECNFEIAISVLPPQKLKSISSQAMKRLVTNIVAIIGACESKFALVGDVNGYSGSTTSKKDQSGRSVGDQNFRGHEKISEEALSEEHLANIEHSTIINGEKSWLHTTRSKDKGKNQLEMIKPKREIESCDVEFLRFLLKQVVKPYQDIQAHVDRTVNVISACIAYAYVCCL